MKYDNPAGRLHAILSAAAGKGDNDIARVVWAQVFGIDSTDAPALMQKLSQLLQLYVDVRSNVTGLLNADVEFLTRYFKNVESALAKLNFEASWGQIKKHLDSTTLSHLEACAYELSRAGMDAKAPAKELDALRQEIEQLIQNIIDSNLDTDFKAFLLKYLRMLQNAILDYRLRGVEGIIEATEQTLGAMHKRPEAAEAVEKAEGLGKRFLKVMQTASVIASLAVNAGKATNFAIRALPDPYEHWFISSCRSEDVIDSTATPAARQLPDATKPN